MFRFARIATCFVALTTMLNAAAPDISNLANCENEVRIANANPPVVQTFDQYRSNYDKLLADLNAALPHLPYVYQEAAAKPFIAFLNGLGRNRYLRIFNGQATDGQSQGLRQIIPDAALALLVYNSISENAFQEIVSDLYSNFLSEEGRAGKQGGRPINPPEYGVLPPLVKFGNQNVGPYTWTAPGTYQMLGMRCAIVSLPPAQTKGGIFAWSALGHETGGHDIIHADLGLIEELSRAIYNAVLAKTRNAQLANYWAKCTDEIASDAMGYLHMGPSVGVSLIGYFRALGNGKLRTIGSTDGTHPIDLLRGYFAAAVAKRLGIPDAAAWSQAIYAEVQKDNGPLYFVDRQGRYYAFPATFAQAVDSADAVAEAILRTPMTRLEGYTMQKIIDWDKYDQDIVDNLVPVIKNNPALPANLQGPGFYAAYVVAAATQAALQAGSNLTDIFNNMQTYLVTMHFDNPTWSTTPTASAIALLEKAGAERDRTYGKHIVRHEFVEANEGAPEEVAIEQLEAKEAETEQVAAA